MRFTRLALLSALGLAAVVASRFQVDGQIPLEREPLVLRLPAPQVLEWEDVDPSPYGLFLWNRGFRLTFRFSHLAAGDLVKVKLMADRLPCRLVWELDGKPLGVLSLSRRFQEFRLLVPEEASRFSVRMGGEPCPVHVSRVKRQGFVATAGEGFFRAYLVSNLKARPHTALGRVAWPCGLAALLALAWAGLLWQQNSRFSGVPIGLWGASAALPVVAQALAAAQGAHPVVPWDTYLKLWLLPQALPALLWLAPHAQRLASSVSRRLLREWEVTPKAWGRLRAFFARPVPRAERSLPPALWAFYACWLSLTLPKTPMEWDEVLFARAVETFDVANHAPHPPGYPLYVAASKLVAALGASAVHATQLASVVGALVALAAAGRFLRGVGFAAFGRFAVLAALALSPAFIFAANLGLSDMLACALALETLRELWLLGEGPSRRRALTTGLVGALALAARPQVGLVLVVPALAVAWGHARRRRWSFLWALPAGLAISAVFWLPAVFITGWQRYRRAWLFLQGWMAEFEKASRFPEMPLSRFVDDWLLRPLGGPNLAFGFWALVVAGSLALWFSGRQRLLGFLWAAAGPYLVVGPFFMAAEASVRYALPAYAVLGLVAGGVTTWRRLFGLLPLGWAVAAFLEVLPALTVRAAEPNPAWAALEFARDRLSISQLTVAPGLMPHAQFVFRGAPVELRFAAVKGVEGKTAFAVVADSRCPGEVWFASTWPREPMASLTRRRYLSACVARLDAPASRSKQRHPERAFGYTGNHEGARRRR